MLKKLLRYDFLAFAHNLFPLQLGVLAGSILVVIFSRLTMNMMQDSSTVLRIFSIFSAFITFLLGVVVFGSSLVTLILICLRVQRNFFEDEGYLTFSLPVSTNQLIWSKVLTGLAWMIINSLVVFVSFLIIGTFGSNQDMLVDTNFLKGVGNFIKQFLVSLPFDDGFSLFIFILLVFNFLACIFMEMFIVYFSVIAGGISVKKYKLLLSIGIYLAAQFCLKFILFAIIALTLTVFSEETIIKAIWIPLLGGIIVQAAVSAGLFLWSRYLLQNKLNLQ